MVLTEYYGEKEFVEQIVDKISPLQEVMLPKTARKQREEVTRERRKHASYKGLIHKPHQKLLEKKTIGGSPLVVQGTPKRIRKYEEQEENTNHNLILFKGNLVPEIVVDCK